RVRALSAEAAARRESDAARKMVAAFIESAPIALLVTDLEMRIIATSPRWTADRGLSGRELTGVSVYDVVPSAKDWGERFRRCLAGETIRADRVEMVRPDGSTLWIQAELTPWRDSEGQIGGLIIASHDITEMVAALERTERSEARLKLALELADVHVYEMDY